MRELARTFEALDTNNNGQLTRDELLVGFTTQMGAVAAQIEVDRIMTSVDMDANGAIDYTEFIAATINKNKLLTKERLKTAFDHFDKVSIKK
jgi:Ca2+-binding EF-hand superfamily protein